MNPAREGLNPRSGGRNSARKLRLICAGRVFERRVLFVRNLGFITPTPARRIGLYETLRTEATHEAAYRELGYDLGFVEPAPLERVCAPDQGHSPGVELGVRRGTVDADAP